MGQQYGKKSTGGPGTHLERHVYIYITVTPFLFRRVYRRGCNNQREYEPSHLRVDLVFVSLLAWHFLFLNALTDQEETRGYLKMAETAATSFISH